MEYFKQFDSKIAQNDLPSVVKLWQEYCLSDEIDPDELIKILTTLKDSSMAPSIGCYVDEILSLCNTVQNEEKKDHILALIFDLQTTNSDSLCTLALDYLSHKYDKSEKNFEHKLRLVGLRDKRNFQGAISNFNILNHMKKNNFFIHTGGWGVGEVLEISMLREQVVMEFDYVAGFKELSFKNAFKVLIPIQNDHFLARRFGDPDSFEVFAKKNPIETIKMLLKDLGPKTAPEIKDEIAELIIAEKDWQKWWQQARVKMKRDTYIQVPANPKGLFCLSIDEVPHEKRLLDALSKKPDVNTLIEMVYSFIRDFSSVLKSQKFKDSIIEHLKDILSQEINEAQEIQIFFILQDLGEKKAENINEVISQNADLEKIFEKIHVITYKKRFLISLQKNYKDYPQCFSNILLICDHNPIREYICNELIASKNEALIKNIIQLVLSDPMQAPQLFLWYFQKVMVGKVLPLSDKKSDFLETFFTLVYQLELSQTNRDLVKKMVQFLINKRFILIRDIFKVSSKSAITEILLLASKCQSLTEHDMKTLYSLAQVIHSDLGKGEETLEEKDEIIWTTQAGYDKLKKRIEQIATVETVETAKEIEAARAHGDLRENSEFKAAIEKRDRLQNELKVLSDQLNQARILTKNDIDTSQASIGTIVTLKDGQGKEESYTLLGPYDADIEKNILSIQSQIAKNLLGLTVGKDCTITGKEYKILSIKSYI